MDNKASEVARMYKEALSEDPFMSDFNEALRHMGIANTVRACGRLFHNEALRNPDFKGYVRAAMQEEQVLDVDRGLAFLEQAYEIYGGRASTRRSLSQRRNTALKRLMMGGEGGSLAEAEDDVRAAENAEEPTMVASPLQQELAELARGPSAPVEDEGEPTIIASPLAQKLGAMANKGRLSESVGGDGNYGNGAKDHDEGVETPRQLYAQGSNPDEQSLEERAAAKAEPSLDRNPAPEELMPIEDTPSKGTSAVDEAPEESYTKGPPLRAFVRDTVDDTGIPPGKIAGLVRKLRGDEEVAKYLVQDGDGKMKKYFVIEGSENELRERISEIIADSQPKKKGKGCLIISGIAALLVAGIISTPILYNYVDSVNEFLGPENTGWLGEGLDWVVDSVKGLF